MKVARAHAHSSQGKSPLLPALIVAALCLLYELTFLYTTHSANPQATLRFVFFLSRYEHDSLVCDKKEAF